jgi:hypothetical protein
MSRANTKQIRTISVEKAAKHKDKWQLHAPYLNNYTKKREGPVYFDHELVCVQIGTPETPVFAPFGMSYWSPQDHKFKSVEGPFDTQWAWADQQTSTFQRKQPGGKGQVQLTLHEYDVPGTPGYFTWIWINNVIDNIVDGLVNGVADLEQLDENGKPKIVPVYDDTAGLPTDPEQLAVFYRRMITPPTLPVEGTYPPALKTKIRYGIQKIGGTDCITLPGTEVRNADGNIKQPIGSELDILKKKTRGVWVVKINPLQLKNKEINLTIDVVLVMAMPPSQSIYKGVGFAESDAMDTDAPVE